MGLSCWRSNWRSASSVSLDRELPLRNLADASPSGVIDTLWPITRPSGPGRGIVRRVSDRSLTPVSSPYLGIVSVVTVVTAIGYTRLLGQQGDWPGIDARQALVLALLAAFAILSAIGTFARSVAVRAAISAACAGGLLPLGFLGLWSIGLLLMVAGALAFIAWRGVSSASLGRHTLVVSAASAIAAIVILAAGFAITG